MSPYSVDLHTITEIETTGNHMPPDQQAPGMNCGSSTSWCRVSQGGRSTGWVECRGVPSIIKAHAAFRNDPVEVAWARVTGTAWPLSG